MLHTTSARRLLGDNWHRLSGLPPWIRRQRPNWRNTDTRCIYEYLIGEIAGIWWDDLF